MTKWILMYTAKLKILLKQRFIYLFFSSLNKYTCCLLNFIPLSTLQATIKTVKRVFDSIYILKVVSCSYVYLVNSPNFLNILEIAKTHETIFKCFRFYNYQQKKLKTWIYCFWYKTPSSSTPIRKEHKKSSHTFYLNEIAIS